MSSSNPSRFLGDDRELALKMFWGKTIEAFRDSTLLWNPNGATESNKNVIAQKDVNAGKSWQFPIMGNDPTPEDHTPGTELLGQIIQMTEGTVTIDQILVAHSDVPLDQTMLSHFDVVEPFARKLGRSVALQLDSRAIRTAIIAARTAASSGYHSGGNVVTRVGASAVTDAYPISSTGAQNFRKDAADLARLMDEDNVPEEGRYLFITPLIREVLGQDSTIFDIRYNQNQNNNVLNKRIVGELEGFQVVVAKGSRIPSTNVNTGLTKYQVDCSRTGVGQPVGVALCGAAEGEAAVAAVMAGGMYSHMHFDERRNTTFMKAQALAGFGAMSVWCAGEIRVPSA